MADFSRRQFKGPPNSSRKRHFRDTGDSERRAQRRRFDEPNHVKLRRQLLGLADNPTKSAEIEIGSLAKNAIELWDEDEHRESLIALATQLVFEQPLKIPLLASFTMLCNLERPDITKELLASVCRSIQQHLQKGSWREVKLGLRMLACLQAWLEEDGIIPILEDLFSRAADLQTASTDDGLGLELIKIILLSIAYLMASPAEGLAERIFSLLEKTDIIASTPHALDSTVNPFVEPSDLGAFEPQSLIGLLQRCLQDEAAKGWTLVCMPRPWKSILSLSIGDEKTRHKLPEITVPSPAQAGHRLRLPEMYLSVYSDQETPTVPPPDDMASLLLRDVLVDTINTLDFNRVATAKFLIDVDCFFPQELFAPRATPFDKIKDIPSDKSTWKPEDVAVDAVFSQLLGLPIPEHKLVYYHSLMTEACKIAPAAIAPSLGRAIRFLYKRLDVLDLELQHRFLDWFSHHLSNFGFTWKWTEWVQDLELPPTNVRNTFIAGLLEKEIRLSVVQRVQGTLPESFHKLLPALKDEDEPPTFKYAEDGAPFSGEARELLSLIRRKDSASEIDAVLSKIQQADPQDGTDSFLASVGVFATCVCFAGSKSLSHLLSYVERCRERLLALSATGEESKRQIITSVMEYWSEKPGTGINVVDKLLNYTILSPISIVGWVFERSQKEELLTRPYAFELVAGTVFKVTNRVRQIISARNQDNLSLEQVELLNETLAKEKVQMNELFDELEAQLDRLGSSADTISDTDASEITGWAQRWLHTFQRKRQVEAMWGSQESLSSGEDAPMENGHDSQATTSHRLSGKDQYDRAHC